MLSVAPLRGTTARVDYLFSPALTAAEHQGFWLGSGCLHAGADPSQNVVPADLLLALEGFAPGTRATLQRRRDRSRLAAWDFTFSVNKSISIAAEDPELAEAIHPAIQAALPAAILFLEHAVSPRYEADDITATYPIISAAFIHRASRWNEPHLHSHLIVLNTCLTDTGWRAVRERRAIAAAQELDRVFQREVHRHLTQAGLPSFLDATEHVALPVPVAACQALSSGLATILELQMERSPQAPKHPRRLNHKRMVANFVARPKKSAEPHANRLSGLADKLMDGVRSAWSAIKSAMRSPPPPPPRRSPPPSAAEARLAMTRALKLDRAPSPVELTLNTGRYHLALTAADLHRQGHGVGESLESARAAIKDATARANLFRALLHPDSEPQYRQRAHAQDSASNPTPRLRSITTTVGVAKSIHR